MNVYVVTGYVPMDSAYRLYLVTLNKEEAEKYVEEHEPETDNPEYGIEWHYRMEETELKGVPELWSQLTARKEKT